MGPATSMIYLGLEIDSVQQLVKVPVDKLEAIKTKIQVALQANKLTLKEVQSLVGSLSFICRAVNPGRPFLRRLIELQYGAKQPWHKIRISEGAKSDLRMWLIFLEDFNGSAKFMDHMWLKNSDILFFTDASAKVGFGGYYDGRWFNGKWPSQKISGRSIAWLEFFPIVVSIVLWGGQLKGKKIILNCDNEAVVNIINKQSSKCPEIMKLLRFFVLQCLKNFLSVCAKHVPGVNNEIADALSRFQMDRFWRAAPGARKEAFLVPDFLWRL